MSLKLYFKPAWLPVVVFMFQSLQRGNAPLHSSERHAGHFVDDSPSPCFLPGGNDTGKWITASSLLSPTKAFLWCKLCLSNAFGSFAPIPRLLFSSVSQSFSLCLFSADWHFCAGDRGAEEGNGPNGAASGQGAAGDTKVGLILSPWWHVKGYAWFISLMWSPYDNLTVL